MKQRPSIHFPEFENHEVALVGRLARERCGGRQSHGPSECAIALSRERIAQRLKLKSDGQAETSPIRHDGWLIWPAQDGHETYLRSRTLAVDAVGWRLDDCMLDPLDGMTEIETGHLSMPSAAPSADAALRLMALSSEQGWVLSPQHLDWISEAKFDVLSLPRERLRTHLQHLLVGYKPGIALDHLRQSAFLPAVLPEVHSLIDFHRSSRHHHKDVWAHTCLVVTQAIPTPIVRWAALLHDIGKVYTRSYGPRGKVQFLKHDEVGAYMFEGIAARLQFPRECAERIRLLILHHLRPGLYESDWSDSAVRRFGQSMRTIEDDLFALSRADITSKRPGNRRRALHKLFELKRRISAVRRRDESKRTVLPTGLGRRIIDELRIEPGPRVGQLRQMCEDAMRQGDLPSDSDIETCLDFLRQRQVA